VESLFEVYRYLGRTGQAADLAERLATLSERLNEPAQVARWRSQKAIVRAGEPLNRVMVRIGERFVELDDAFPARGESVEFVYRRSRPTLSTVQARVGAGEKLGAAGDLEGALASFREAAALDPHDPHSRYLAGVTLSYLERASDALEFYRDTERLAPGWFNVRAYLALARKMALGRVETELFRPITALLADAEEGAAERLEFADDVLEDHPDLAIVHLGRGAALRRLERREESVAALRRGLDCVDDDDVKTRLYLALGIASTRAEERRALLEEAAALNGNLVAAAMATIALRAEERDRGA